MKNHKQNYHLNKTEKLYFEHNCHIHHHLHIYHHHPHDDDDFDDDDDDDDDDDHDDHNDDCPSRRFNSEFKY